MTAEYDTSARIVRTRPLYPLSQNHRDISITLSGPIRRFRRN
jgi:hypothetical protein